MKKFSLILSPGATRDLDRIDESLFQVILDALPLLRENPFPQGKRIKKIKGKKAIFYRLRVDKHRIFYSIEGMTVVILSIIGKKDADRFIKKL